MLFLAIALFLLAFLVLWAAIHHVLPPAWGAVQSVWAGIARAILQRERFAVWYERGTARLRPLHPYRALLVVLALGFVTAALTGAAFMSLAELMQEKDPVLALVDEAVWRAARELRSPGATTFFLVFTLLGTGVGLGVLVVLIAVSLAARGHVWRAVFLVVTGLGGGVLNHGLKVLFERARPDMEEALWRSHSYAFPSGHAMGSFVVFGALVYLVIRASPSARVRSAAVALAVCLTGTISLSRIYLGVHWFSDIVAGLSAGLVWLATTTAVYEVNRRMRLLRTTRVPAGQTTPDATAGRRATG